MNYLRKAFNLYQLTHRVDASTTDIKDLDESNDDNEGGGKNGDSTRSAATKARAIDMFTKRVEFSSWYLGVLGKVGSLYLTQSKEFRAMLRECIFMLCAKRVDRIS